MQQIDHSYLLKARGIAAVGAIAVIIFDLVMIHLMPEEPTFSGPRYFCASVNIAFLVASILSAHVRQHASNYMLLAVISFTVTWSYNLFLSQFSMAIVLTFFLVVVGCSAILRYRIQVSSYLVLSMACYMAALLYCKLDVADTALSAFTIVTLCALCYVNLSTMIARQEEILRSRALLEQVVEEIPDALWLAKSNSNKAEIANQKGFNLASTLTSSVQQYEAKQAHTNNSPWTFENEVQREDGSRYWGDVWIRRLAIGRDQLFLARVSDITEQREAQAALLQAKSVAEDALETRSRFLANMSHEIRTPMNGVVAMTGLLLESELDNEQREFANTIRTSSEALITIINDILDFSKIDSGELELELQYFSLEQCVAEAAELMASLALEKQLELTYVIEPLVPTNCIGDMSRLRQVLLNLVSNAIKFTPKGEVVIRVWVEGGVNADGQQKIHFGVKDTGIGIPADRLSHMFDPFTQADASTTRVYGGTGLGLAISRQLTELMGGRIEVNSQEGVGSEFHFYVVVGEPKSDSTTLPELAGRKVLIVDDNKTNLTILRKILEKDGVDLVEHLDPIAALEDASAHDFDACVLDFHMPGMDGFELGKALSKITDAPLMLLSSNALIADENLFDIRVNKPVRPSLLRQNLKAMIAKEIPTREEPNHPTHLNNLNLNSLRVLVAEDNPVNQLVIKKVLNKLSITPDVVNNGKEAVALSQQKSYDLILMDVQMPVMDGLMATQEIRSANFNHPHIIALTANAMDGDREVCLKAGMDDYMSKPLNLDALRQRLTELVSSAAHSHPL